MSCNTKTSLAAVIDAVNAQLNNNYVDRDDPRIDQGVFTEPTIRGGLMLDEAAKLDFCGYVTECGQREPFGKQWVDRPLYPHNTLVSYEDGGEIKSRWQDTDDVVAGTEIGESYTTYEETRSLGLQGYTIIDSFELGATLTQRNEALRHAADSKLYRWTGDLPKTVPVGSTPTDSGGIGPNAWLEVSDMALRQELISPAGGFLIGGVPIVIGTMDDLVKTIRLPNKTYLLKRYFADFDGTEVIYEWNPDYPKQHHNGGTIIDPDHSVMVGASEDWYHGESTGQGCFVMLNADTKQLNVQWFGARNDTDMFNPSYDSWGAFDATYRTAFWNHKEQKYAERVVRRIVIPNNMQNTRKKDSSITSIGYYVGKRITDETSGFPLTQKGTLWSGQVVDNYFRDNVVVFDGLDAPVFGNMFVGIAKAPNDYLFRFKWTRTEYYNLAIAGVTGDYYPAILVNNKIVAEALYFRGVNAGDPSLYGAEIGGTPENGLVPYDIGVDIIDRPPTSFVIGMINDISETGSNSSVTGALSNINSCYLRRISGIYCKGTLIFSSCKANANTRDVNGGYFEIENGFMGETNALITLNGSTKNRGVIHTAQSNFAAFHFYDASGKPSSNNHFELSYYGDFNPSSNDQSVVCLDSFGLAGGVNNNQVRTVNTNYAANNTYTRGKLLYVPIAVDSIGTRIRLKSSNAVYTTGVISGGTSIPVKVGMGNPVALPHSRAIHADFTSDNVTGEMLEDGKKQIKYYLHDLLNVNKAELDEARGVFYLDFWFSNTSSIAAQHSSFLISIQMDGYSTAVKIGGPSPESSVFDGVGTGKDEGGIYFLASALPASTNRIYYIAHSSF